MQRLSSDQTGQKEAPCGGPRTPSEPHTENLLAGRGTKRTRHGPLEEGPLTDTGWELVYFINIPPREGPLSDSAGNDGD